MNAIQHRVATVLFGLTGILAAGCQDSTPATTPRGLAIEVAPLTLPGIVNATYTLTVKNGLGQTVWTAGPISSTQYGNGQGALSYVGPCDAQDNPNSVELVLNSLTATTGPLSSPADYVNPTIDATGKVTPLVVGNLTCVENADVPVTFNLTIMRRANQGFFDIAVNFDDIFCSAKLDCSEALLTDADGDRGPTVIFGFACTGGVGDGTHLYLSNLALECTNGAGVTTTQTIPVAGATVGQHGPLPPGIFNWGTYQDEEFVEQTEFDKCFWNMSIGLNTTALAGQTCTLSAVGTASQDALTANASGQYVIPNGGAYPIIKWDDVQVLSANGTLCENNGLDVPGSHVVTGYVSPGTVVSELAPLVGTMLCGGQDVAGCSLDTTFGNIVTTPTTGGFTMTATDGSIAPGAMALPDGWALGTTCCAPACCQ